MIASKKAQRAFVACQCVIALGLAGAALAARAEIQTYSFLGTVNRLIDVNFLPAVNLGDQVSFTLTYDNTPVPAANDSFPGVTYYDEVLSFSDVVVGSRSGFTPTNNDGLRKLTMIQRTDYVGFEASQTLSGSIGGRALYSVGFSVNTTNAALFPDDSMPSRLPNANEFGPPAVDRDLLPYGAIAGYLEFESIGRGEPVGSVILFSVDRFQQVTAPVPEPETYGLMLAGLAVVGLYGRRRSRTGPAPSAQG